jgi:hypothetical protein
MHGQEILLGKNIAYFLLSAAEALPLLLAAAIRLALPLTLAGLMAGDAVVLLSASWGNYASVRSPVPREFYNLDSREQAGGMLCLLLSLAGSTLLVLGSAWFWHRWGGWALLVHLAGVAGCGMIYRRGLPGAGRALDQGAEVLRVRLGRR